MYAIRSYYVRRLAQAVIALLAISLIVFAMTYLQADPVDSLLPQTASKAQREALRVELGLDQPLAAQYARYMGRLLRGWQGSGTIFLAWCNLRCVFCQNFETSQMRNNFV